jgi:hypothetical protein
MDDGCCVCSPKVMRLIREKLDLSETPSAVQGRLGGAKGMWFMDPEADRYSDEVWIKVNESQLKYKFHDSDTDGPFPDWARLTLFVLNYSKEPPPAKLNLQLAPILKSQGVPFDVLRELLEDHLDEDLTELQEAASDRVTLRHWLSKHIAPDRRRAGEVAHFESGTPRSNEEQICMLLDAGFEPQQCGFLMEKVNKIIEQECDEILQKLHIRMPCSAVVYCVADPTGTLEPTEVSLQFSKGFMDTITMMRHECVEGDVLVARNPAHLPTDIQKVCFKQTIVIRDLF